MLQGFPTHMPKGQPYQLVGKSDVFWRERIGNAVTPATAQAIAESMLLALMASSYDEWNLGYTDIWVMPEREVGELDILRILHYPGSKWSIASWIIDHMPEHKTYLEPFSEVGQCSLTSPLRRLKLLMI